MKNLITILLAIAFSTSVAFASASSDTAKDAKAKDAKEEVKGETPATTEEVK